MVTKIAAVAAFLYTALITYLSLAQLGKINVGTFSPTDKMMHAGAYFVLVGVWQVFFILKSQDNQNYKQNLYKISAASILFGMLIEVLQGTLTSHREPDWYDILANSIGALLAVLIFLSIKNFLKRLKSKIF
ncbi:VanZ family protein [Salegentibacter sp. F188]|uniref:VanZ family protein n=1 Tax=Autumnicola patrickiae TaxID=3075591 RepID=A0ABU3E005_9FLAO|nr:VanZ family protein [Salegentibacter sp. F188]MDT0689298.1 VanZ family protein [Salegentibacter sp. F188]